MTTSKERELLTELNGTARSTHPFRTSFPWTQPPTPISPSISAPSNNPPPLRMVQQQPGKNPWGENLNRRGPLVGNPTSNRVLGEPPARKKPRMDLASGHPYTRLGGGNNNPSKRNHEISIAEPIDVDEDSIMPGDHSHATIRSSSPDQLDVLEGPNHPSKYKIDELNRGSTVRDNPTIAPDGAHTEWAKKAFAQSGQVREEIAKIEAKTRTRIDLKSKVKMKPKTKAGIKSKDNKLVRRQEQPAQEPSRPQTKKKILPLKELYLDGAYHCHKLEIHWPNDKLIIKSDKINIFGPFDIRADAGTLIYHDSPDPPTDHSPVFQLTTIPGGKHGTPVRCVTVKLDCSGDEDSYYTGLLVWLKDRVEKKETVRGASARQNVWDSVAWEEDRGSEFSTKQGNLSKARLDELRQGEPQRAKRSLIDDRSKPAVPQKRSSSQTSMRITPPPSSVVVPSIKKPRQRSRPDTSDLPVAPRRSTRNMSGARRSPALDSDEVILVYPPGVPGAVNITNGDFHRLQPNEFLNDTLIEFGLKLWLKELEQENPTLASQIHIFNSFFYKKLNQKKGGTNLGYESVRKWTSKFDIFEKKYIIVPINENLHWYFAIICDPEYVLLPPLPTVSPTRRQTRHSVLESIVTDEPNETPIASKPVSTSVSTNGKNEDKLGTPSETEVEETLHGFHGSCSISNIEPENVADLEDGRSLSALSYLSDHELRPLSPTASDHERAPSRHSPSDEDMTMDGDLSANLDTTSHDDLRPRPVDAASFYRPASPKKDKGKRKADPKPESFVMEIDDDGGGSVVTDIPKTYIFTFDSLNGRHPQALKRLSEYLQKEATDKKKAVSTRNAAGKDVPVPAQPNFCDCGIYLLHLAETFMRDPEHYQRMILAQKRTVPNEERQAVWLDHQVSDKREQLRARIRKLSGEWKKERAAKEEAKHKEGSNSYNVEEVESDCDIDILEPTPSNSRVKSAGKKKTGQAANRMRG